MAFKPQAGNNTNGPREDFQPRDFPTPEGGSQEARLSLIIDLGIQEREDFVDPKTKEEIPQAPKHQICIFADLVEDIVDYGGEIGKQPYRLMLNKSFKGDISGINFSPVPPRDADGNLIEGRAWTYHPASPLTKLAKVVGASAILDGSDLDIEALLDTPFMATVNVKITESDKTDKDGNKIVYKNVNYGGCAEVPKKMKGSVAPLLTPAMVITFDDVTVEQAKFIRADVRRKIKMALNYPGSKMQEVLESLGESKATPKVDKPAAKPAARDAAPQAAVDEHFDDELPF